MKYTKYFSVIFLISLAGIIFSPYARGQKNTDNADAKKLAIKNMIDSQHFVFVAQTATPLRGSIRNLTSLYDVSISKDTMVSYLPYFGRAYSAPLDPSSAGLSLTSRKFLYTVTPYKKDGWNVVIKPKDNPDVEQFQFTIFDNGSASLNVRSVSRDPITFSGFLQKEKKKKK